MRLSDTQFLQDVIMVFVHKSTLLCLIKDAQCSPDWRIAEEISSLTEPCNFACHSMQLCTNFLKSLLTFHSSIHAHFLTPVTLGSLLACEKHTLLCNFLKIYGDIKIVDMKILRWMMCDWSDVKLICYDTNCYSQDWRMRNLTIWSVLAKNYCKTI